MLSTLLRYEIETIQLDGDKLGWKLRHTITPNYNYTKFVEEKRFLWWKWSIDHHVILNERKARIRASHKAFRYAKRLYPEYNVRVYVVFKFKGLDPIRHCVWENGLYYSTD